MLNKIQIKIDGLAQGKKLILGSGISADDMKKVVELCETLHANGQIHIVKMNKGSEAKNALVTGIMLEKI